MRAFLGLALGGSCFRSRVGDRFLLAIEVERSEDMVIF